jgi:uncharacterized membrane protein YedE/YeeE
MDLFAHRAPWYVAGSSMGVAIVGLRALVNKPFGALGGYIDLADHARHPSRLGFRSFLLFGFVLGGFLFALLSGTFAPAFGYERLLPWVHATGAKWSVLACSGLVMGYGARMAGGCTSGHGMCGTSLASPASFVASATFFATAVSAGTSPLMARVIVKTKALGLAFGAACGVVVAWARLSDPEVIRDMLMLREPHVFLLMGSAVAVAAVGVRVLRAFGLRALLSGEAVGWNLVRPETRHIAGSVLFGIGWSVAGTCPGPVAVMIGEGHLAGLVVVSGLLAGVLLQRARERRSTAAATHSLPEVAGAAGL